ncbi:putative ATP-dependent RNA helicase ddx49 [Lobosporangium transversale]|nr:putative ATP-dependent RNA helicase ddx49 [Lobosporangium transversale]
MGITILAVAVILSFFVIGSRYVERPSFHYNDESQSNYIPSPNKTPHNDRITLRNQAVVNNTPIEPTCGAADDDCFVYRPEAKLAFITSYFQGRDDERQSELDVCIASLFAVDVLDQIHVMIEAKDAPILPKFVKGSSKYHEHLITERPLMGDFIQYACDHLMDYRVLYANSDISYDMSLEFFTKISDKIFENTFYAISRWRLTEKGMTAFPYPEWGSYDTFVFSPRTICSDKTKLKEIVSNLNYTLGISGSENRLLYEIKRQYPDLQLINPVYTVKTVHHHRSSYRADNYEERVHTNGRSVTIPPPFII